jgi:cellulose/xylan binding protein with CBM9 domain
MTFRLLARVLVIALVPYCLTLARGTDPDSATYSRFAGELRQYLPNNMIIPLFSKLPAGASVYGYDLGDITGNGERDLVVSLKKPKTRHNETFIYFFSSKNSKFELIKVLKRRWNQDPLEVAFYIEDGICYVTDKIKDKHWRVDGYSIDKFVFRHVNSWENFPLRGGKIGNQIESNYLDMKTSETHYKTTDLKEIIKSRYLTVPAFPSGITLPADLPSVVGDTSYRMVMKGTSNWFGPEDCSLSVLARYDSSFLNIYAVIRDDLIIGGDSIQNRDALELWLDCNGKHSYLYNSGTYHLRAGYAKDVLGIEIAASKGSTFSEMNISYSGFKKRSKAVSAISSTAAMLKGGGWLIRCSIPWELLDGAPPENDIGFAYAYTDVDDSEKRHWYSLLANSDHFRSAAPYTFGRMMFIGWNEVPFERDDFRMRPLLKELSNSGVLPR